MNSYHSRYPDRTDGSFYSGFTIAYFFNTMENSVQCLQTISIWCNEY